MAVADTVRAFLEDRGVEYQVVPHAPAGSSSETAQAAHVPGARLAKAVVVEDPRHCAVVVVPATEQVHLGDLRRELGDTYALATEDRIRGVFQDCALGSIPPFGQAYGLEVLLDESLLQADRVFVEGGDRGALLAISGEDFRRLMQDARLGNYHHTYQDHHDRPHHDHQGTS